MKAVILVGGLGTRLRPVTYEIPKPLLPVKKKPILSHLADLLMRHGVRDIAVLASASHRSDFEKWRKEYRDKSPQANITIFFEDKPRGTFGGMEMVRDWIGDDVFILSNGDELKDFDLTRLADFHNEQKPLATIALVRVPNPQEYGVPILDGNRITEFLEKPVDPPSEYVSSGLYVLEPAVFDRADFSKEYIMVEKDIFPRLAAENKLAGLKMEGGRWYDCGSLERWERAIKEW